MNVGILKAILRSYIATSYTLGGKRLISKRKLLVVSVILILAIVLISLMVFWWQSPSLL